MEFKELMLHYRNICKEFRAKNRHNCPLYFDKYGNENCDEWENCRDDLTNNPEWVEKTILRWLNKEKFTFDNILQQTTKTAKGSKEVVFKKGTEALYIHQNGAQYTDTGRIATFDLFDSVPEEIIETFKFRK